MSPTTSRNRTKARWVAVGVLAVSLAACRPLPHPRGHGGGPSHGTTVAAAPGTLEVIVRQDGEPVAGIDGWAFATDAGPQHALDHARSFTTDANGRATITATAGRWAAQAWGPRIPAPQSGPDCSRDLGDDAVVYIVANAAATVTLDLVAGPVTCENDLISHS